MTDSDATDAVTTSSADEGVNKGPADASANSSTASTYAPNSGLEWLHVALVVGMFVASALCWSSAPDQIPMHWNVKGEVDRYGGKLEGLFLLPAITAGLYLLLRFVPAVDPGKANYAQFSRVYSLIRMATTLVMVIVHGVTLAWALGYPMNMGAVVSVSVGGLFLLLGNVMGKIRPNWFVGIRTPWTLSSKLSWTRTHRVGGWLFMAMGVAILACGFFQSEWAIGATLVGTLGGTLFLVIYSFYVWRQDESRIPPAGTLPAVESEDREAI